MGEELEYVDSGIDALPELLNTNAQYIARHGALLMEYPTTSVCGSSNHRLQTSHATASELLQLPLECRSSHILAGVVPLRTGLQPATWRDEPLSDLSSRSTSPGTFI